MIKIPYEIMAVEVDKMYPPHYVMKPNETLEEHLSDIEAFIESCGWSVQEYIEEYIHRGIKEHFPSPMEMN